LTPAVKQVRIYGAGPGSSRNAFFTDQGGQLACTFLYIESRDPSLDLAKYLVAADDVRWRENPDDILVKLGIVQRAWRRSDGKAVALYREIKRQDWTTKDLVIVQQGP
jgi:hypothetical protein